MSDEPSLAERVRLLEKTVGVIHLGLQGLVRRLESIQSEAKLTEIAKPKTALQLKRETEVKGKHRLTVEDVRSLPWVWYENLEGKRGWLIANGKIRKTKRYELNDEQVEVLKALIIAVHASPDKTVRFDDVLISLEPMGRFLRISTTGYP